MLNINTNIITINIIMITTDNIITINMISATNIIICIISINNNN